MFKNLLTYIYYQACEMLCWTTKTILTLFLHPLPQHTERSRRETAPRQTPETTARKWVECCHDPVCVYTLSVQLFSIVCRLSRWLFFPQGNGQLQNGDGNSRHASLSEEEENLAVLRRWGISRPSFICNQVTRQMDCVKTAVSLSIELCIYLFWVFLHQILRLISFCLSASPSILSAGTLWTSCWKLREPTWRSCSVYYRCLLTPQNVYSLLPLYLCLMLCLCALQGYASEMDNPAVVHLIPAPLQNKKEVLFGNMPEIYHFHKRWRSAICLSLMIWVRCDMTCC